MVAVDELSTEAYELGLRRIELEKDQAILAQSEATSCQIGDHRNGSLGAKLLQISFTASHNAYTLIDDTQSANPPRATTPKANQEVRVKLLHMNTSIA
ncbi:hypothetical protein PsorP6_008260 [Peronosclerospora sorghi]|uniref:Uncharacterized protein n=1 Tax=Peronosclerospora sorghi TaxID=230839 RepID=A0ACC0WAF2_9STRA|nr:hypothetical protein PsorP6_008260 [Peronosclerospora sorghi]